MPQNGMRMKLAQRKAETRLETEQVLKTLFEPLDPNCA